MEDLPVPRVAARSASLGQRLITASPAVLGAATIVLFLIVQWLYLKPPSPLDPLVYFNAAASFPDIALEHRQMRFGLVLPVALLCELLGYSTSAYYIVPLLSATLLTGAVFVLGLVLFGRLVGCLAAVLTTFNGYILIESSLLMPDVMATALFTMAIALLLIDRSAAYGGPTRRQVWLLVGSGALLGWSYLTREFIAFLFPLVPLLFVMLGVPLRWLRYVAIPALGLLGLELALNAAIFGNPLARLEVAGGHGQGDLPSGVRAESFQNKSAGEILMRLPDVLVDRPEGVLMLILLATLLVAAIRLKDVRIRLLAAWFMIFWLALTLVGGLLFPSSPSLRIQLARYWFPVFPAIVVGGLGAAGLAWAQLRRRAPDLPASLHKPVLVGAVMLTAALSVADLQGADDEYAATGANHLPQLRHWLSSDGAGVRTIWTDGYTAALLPLYAHSATGKSLWNGRIRIFAPDAPPRVSAADGASAVVLYGTTGNLRQDPPCGACKLLAAQTLGTPAVVPAPWTIALETPDRVLQVFTLPGGAPAAGRGTTHG